MENITVSELSKLISDPDAEILLVDVREAWERELCAITESLHIPMNTVPNSLEKLEFNLPIVIYCHHGMRSMQVGMYLESHGYNHVLNLEGGIDACAREVDQTMAQY